MWDTLKKYAGPVLLGFGVVGIVAAIVYEFSELMRLAGSTLGSASQSLPLLAIGGVIVLILLLTAVAMIFSVLGLANKEQAMGLPEGSIRAVIALSLIVLFAILSVFLYQGVAGGPANIVENLSEDERTEFIKNHPAARDLQSQAFAVKDKAGEPLTNPDGTPKLSYNVIYRSAPDTASIDFAKQLLVLLGTLMTAITSFYLGAGTATSAAAAAQATDSTAPPPTISSISPTTHSIGNDGPVLHLQVMGSNLNVMTNAKIVRGGIQVIGTNVASNPTRVICDIAVSAATTPPGPPWDVVVDDGGSQSARLPSALTINA